MRHTFYCLLGFIGILSLSISTSFAQLYINEFMASNSLSYQDEQGDFDDWIEIYNAGASAVDLASYYLSDDFGNLQLWQIPGGDPAKTTVPAGGFLVLWADNEAVQGANHLGFKLSAGGESIALSDPLGNVLDSLSFGSQLTDVSFGRTVDAGPVWNLFTSPSPGLSNGSGASNSITYEALYSLRVAAGNQDAEESATGTMMLSEPEIEMGQGPGGAQYVGLRFTGLELSQGQIITDAHLQFQSAAVNLAASNLEIRVELADQASAFSSSNFNLSARTLSDSVVYWTPDPWTTTYANGNDQKSPELRKLIQEVVNRPGWAHGNDLVLIILGSGTRSFTAYEQDNIRAARLVIKASLNQTNDPISNLYINEILANNANTNVDEYDEDEDWIELYNANPFSVNIGGLFVTDNPNNPDKWQIAYPEIIPAGGFALIWLDNDPNQGGLHSDNIKLDQNGEHVALVQMLNGSPVILDSISFGPQTTDVSFGRLPDGSANLDFMAIPSPASTNNGTTPKASRPNFSLESGFYTSNQTLTISTATPAASIRYTTDGRVPTASSSLYTGPISINATSVIRAKTFKSGYAPSDIQAGTYFMNVNEPFPVFSFLTDPDSMFSTAQGIYINADAATMDARKDWMRQGSLQYFNLDDSLLFEGEFDTRLFGRSAIYFPQKSLSFFTRPGETVNVPLFPHQKDLDEYKSFKIRNSSDDWPRTMFACGFQQSLFANEINIAYEAFQPTVLYINGTYQGIHNLRDKYNEDYLKYNYGADPQNIDFIKKIKGAPNGLNEVLAGDVIHYENMVDFVQNNNMALASNYDFLKTQMDVNDYMDFVAVEMFIANRSWEHNRRFWRPKTPEGRWRWLINDLDRGYKETNRDVLAEWMAYGDLFPYLMQNPDFMHEYLQRSATWMNTVFEPARAISFIDSLEQLFLPEMPDHIGKWGGVCSSYGCGVPDMTTWASEVDLLRTFAVGRKAVLVGQYAAEFGVSSSMITLSINYDAQSNGTVHINDIEYQLPYNFSGEYFANCPVTITAKPNQDFRFVHWLETGNTNPTVVLNTASHTTLTPIFVEKNPRITEIHYNPIEGADYEFIELYNPSTEILNLNGFYFDKGIEDTLHFSMNPGEYVIIARDSTIWTAQGITAYQWSAGFLADNGETIRLKDAVGKNAEKISYDNRYPWPESADGHGSSLSLKKLDLDNDDPLSWKACCGHISPGAANESPIRQPGAIQNGLRLWLRADDASFIWPGPDLQSPVWLDQSGNKYETAQSQINQAPVYIPKVINGNAALQFDGQDDWLELDTLAASLSGTATIFAVFQPMADNDEGYFLSTNANGLNRVKYGHNPAGQLIYDPFAAPISLENVLDQSIILSIDQNVSQIQGHINGIPGNVWTGFNLTGANQVSIGQEWDLGVLSNHWKGHLSELIVYDQALTNSQRFAVETFLNIKYGINIPVGHHLYYDYAGFPNQITGIGQDNAIQCLNQRNSRHSANGAVLRIRKPADLQDGEYLVWGHDGNGLTETTINLPTGYHQRISRTWRISETGETGPVKVIIDLSGSGIDLSTPHYFALAMDGDDGNFVNANTITEGRSIVGDSVIFTGVDLQDGHWMTLTTFTQCPATPPIQFSTATTCDSALIGLDTIFHVTALGCDSLEIIDYGWEVSAPTLSEQNGSDCLGLASLQADPPGADVYEWFLDGVLYTNTGAFPVYAPTEAGFWQVRRVVNNCASDLSAGHTVLALPNTPALGVAGGNPECDGAILEATGSSGASYEWYKNGLFEAVTPGNTFGPVGGAIWSVRALSAQSCYSAASNDLEIFDIPATPQILISGGGVPCISSILTTDIVGEEEYEWYWNGVFITNSGDNPFFNYPSIGDWEVRYRIGPCWSNLSNPITVDYCDEICDNGIDDDGDGDLDCLDYDCSGQIACDTVCAPGELLGGLKMWLRADAGISSPVHGAAVSFWADQSAYGNNASQADPVDQPIFQDAQINGNPTLRFDGLNDWMKINGAAGMLSDSCSIFVVGIPYTTVDEGYYISSHLGGSNRIKMGHNALGELIYDDDVPSLSSANYLNRPFMTSFDVIPDQTMAGYIDGNLSTPWNGFNSSGADRASIGQEFDAQGNDNQTSNHWNGDLAEMIIYDHRLTADQQHAVETYLSIRYGISIPVSSHLYYDFNSYSHDLAGLGQNLLSANCWSQASSKSVNPDGIIRVSDPSQLETGEYLVWGNDDQSLLSASASTNVPPNYIERMERVWRISETGEVGTIRMDFDLGGLGWDLSDTGEWVLLVDTDADLSDGEEIYYESRTINGNTLSFEGINLDHGQYFTLARRPYVRLSGQAFLQGPYDSIVGLMRDDLRLLNLIPVLPPYNTLPGFTHSGNEKMDSSLLSISGPEAIVDWVLLELRNPADISEIIGSSAVLIKRNGSLMDPTGASSFEFVNVPAGNYLISVRHRNHLGILTQNVYSLTDSPINIDFSDPAILSSPHALVQLSAAEYGLWAGDINADGIIRYEGASGDNPLIKNRVENAPGNLSAALEYVEMGYLSEDLDMDGRIIFQGPDHDSEWIFKNILAHPLNPAGDILYFIPSGLP